MKRTHIDLFSGVGGFTLACEWAGVETIVFAEIDDYANRFTNVLKMPEEVTAGP